MNNDPNECLGALLAILPLAEKEAARCKIKIIPDREDLLAINAISRAHSVLLRWMTNPENADQETWKIAMRHNDVSGAIRLCSEINGFAVVEAQTMVSWYNRVCLKRQQLIGEE